jgi:hypothetical protein
MSEAEVERAYLESRPVPPPDPDAFKLPHQWFPKVERDPDPVYCHEVVRAVVHKYEMSADAIWDMCIPDLFLMLKPPEEATTTTTDRGEQIAMCIMLDERIQALAALSIDERVELEQWKYDLM